MFACMGESGSFEFDQIYHQRKNNPGVMTLPEAA